MDIDNLVMTIFDGRQVENNLAQKLTDLLNHGAVKAEMQYEKTMGGATEDLSVFERIQIAKGVFDKEAIQTLTAPYENYFQKSSELSIKLREKGNDLYKNKNVEGALRAYTLALAFAPTQQNGGTNEALLAYTNRSAVLLQKNCNKEALLDIQSALTLASESHLKDLPIPNLKEKLAERMGKCEQTIGKLQSKMIGVTCGGGEGEGEDDKKNTQQNQQEIMKTLFQVREPNTTVQNVEDFVKFNYSRVKGRHLVVTRNVEAGTVLLIDQPFVSVLSNLLRWETEHCHNCSRMMVNGIPCQECTFALFCSEECREAGCNPSEKGRHHLEHKYLPILHCLDSSHGELKALRILASVGPEVLLEFKKSLTMPSISDQMRMPGFDKNGIYDVSSYLPIYHLISHPFPPSLSEDSSSSFQNCMKALFLKEILKSYTNFFAKFEKGKKEDFEGFVAGLILKHLENIRFNAIALSKIAKERGSNGATSTTKSVGYASAVYPLISLCNHSCDPNCAPVKQSKYLVTSLLALKHLNKGDELFITYKPLYTQMKTSERQRYLAERYRFICSCQACENNWGPDQFNSEGDAMIILQPTKCDKCPIPPPDDDDTTTEDKDTPKKTQCHNCALKDLGKVKDIQEMEQVLFECHDLFEEGDYLECLKRLPEVVDYFGREGFQSYFPLYNVALDLYKRSLVHSVSQLQFVN